MISINREIVWVHSKNLEELVAGNLLKTVNSLAEFLVENIAKLFEINHSLFRKARIEDKLPKIQFGEIERINYYLIGSVFEFATFLASSSFVAKTGRRVEGSKQIL